jgi:hypothetical protein
MAIVRQWAGASSRVVGVINRANALCTNSRQNRSRLSDRAARFGLLYHYLAHPPRVRSTATTIRLVLRIVQWADNDNAPPTHLDRSARRRWSKPNRRSCAALARQRTFAADTMGDGKRKWRSFADGMANR